MMSDNSNFYFHSGNGDNPEITFYPSREIEYKTYFVDGQRHRLDGPAFMNYYKSGQIASEHYYINGRQHRLDGPARIWYYETGKIKGEEYYVNGFYLYDFDKYEKNKIFEYIKDHPKHLNEIEILARYNKWLTEKELLLLRTITTFT